MFSFFLVRKHVHKHNSCKHFDARNLCVKFGSHKNRSQPSILNRLRTEKHQSFMKSTNTARIYNKCFMFASLIVSLPNHHLQAPAFLNNAQHKPKNPYPAMSYNISQIFVLLLRCYLFDTQSHSLSHPSASIFLPFSEFSLLLRWFALFLNLNHTFTLPFSSHLKYSKMAFNLPLMTLLRQK